MVLVMMGLFTGFVALIFGPIISAPSKHQAKADTVLTAAQIMYRLQRDIRQSHPSGIWVCTNSSSPMCAQPTATPTSAPVLAVLTSRSSGNGQAQWDSNNGQPLWQGFNVYWLVPDGQGSNNLAYAFSPYSGGPINFTTVEGAVQSALQNGGETVAHAVYDLQTSLDVPTSTAGLRIFSQSTVSGHTNETSYESDTVIRNN